MNDNTKRTERNLLAGILAIAMAVASLEPASAATITEETVSAASVAVSQIAAKGLSAANEDRVNALYDKTYPLYDELWELRAEYDKIDKKYKAAKKKENKAKKKGYKIHGVVETVKIYGKTYTVLTVENDSAERDGSSYVIPKKYNNSKYLIQSHKIAWTGHSYHWNMWVGQGKYDMEELYVNDDASREVFGHVPFIRVNYGAAKLKKKRDKIDKKEDKLCDEINEIMDEIQDILDNDQD